MTLLEGRSESLKYYTFSQRILLTLFRKIVPMFALQILKKISRVSLSFLEKTTSGAQDQRWLHGLLYEEIEAAFRFFVLKDKCSVLNVRLKFLAYPVHEQELKSFSNKRKYFLMTLLVERSNNSKYKESSKNILLKKHMFTRRSKQVTYIHTTEQG